MRPYLKTVSLLRHDNILALQWHTQIKRKILRISSLNADAAHIRMRIKRQKFFPCNVREF